MQPPIRLLLVDDHEMFCQGLRLLLSRDEDFEVVGQAPEAETGLRLAVRYKPAVVVSDVVMPGLDCFEMADQIQRQLPRCRVLFLSGFIRDRYIERALGVGGWGYLDKTEPVGRLAQAIRRAAQGQRVFSESVRSRLIFGAGGEQTLSVPRTRSSLLSERERQVLRYVAQGLPRRRIAALMRLGEPTVATHTSNLMRKLDLHDRVALARFAMQEGLGGD
jgi:NarL family two-component system response regulator LiaR